MKKNNKFLTVLCLILLAGCAVQGPKFAEGEKKENFNYPSDKEIEKRFYLLGDAGYSKPDSISNAIYVFRSFLDSTATEDDYVIFLGDNIYPRGMPQEGHKRRADAEHKLQSQLNAVANFQGQVIFMPGNHDWYSNGIEGLEDQKEYIDNNYEGDAKWTPEVGTGIEIIDVNENITIIALDSQWYLEDWDQHPKVNDNAAEIKTRHDMFLEVESELKKAQNKTIIFAIHHPLYTNGIHGGHYSFRKHLYPTQSVIPLPILGTISMLIRTTGGVSIQDAQNEQYKGLVNRLTTMAQDYERLIFVSGHEHNLQYIINNNIKQIVSGAGSKTSPVGVRDDGLFAYPDQGFAVYDVFKDGSSWVSFYSSNGLRANLLYQKEVFEAPGEYDTSNFPTTFPATVKASIYDYDEAEKTDFYESVWGDRYRELYGEKITVDVANLDTLYGGLEAMRKGGGHQTKSLRLRDSLGREYNMRALRKSAVQFLQTVAFKDKPITEMFENTLAEEIIMDFYTSAHPYGFMVIPTLSEAVDIYHPRPKLFYVPKQRSLGKYNEEYGNELYMIEERPEENWVGTEGIFGNPNHDIESTSGLYNRLRRDEKYVLDEDAYIRARLFDMLVGDWDRHHDQWRWHENEEEDGTRIMKPIPRDRDQVFSNFDGALLATLGGILGMGSQFVSYEGNIDDIEWFNKAALGMDRSLIQNKGRDSWIREAKFIQENLAEEIIEEAFAQLPEETQDESSEEIKQNFKERLGNLVDIANRYYEFMSTLAVITATDKDDYIEIMRLEDGKTRVVIHRIKNGEKDDLVSDRTYNADETEEIWVYGLDDDDIFEVTGEDDELIFVRLIGGQNNDVYRIKTGEDVKVYDYKSKPSTVEEKGDAVFRFTDDYEVNAYNKERTMSKSTSITPAFGYNPDDGVLLGIQGVYTANRFRRNPFTTQHRLRFGYFFATDGFDAEYSAEFANIWGGFNFIGRAVFTSPNFARNFFGYGNETYNPEDERTRDYNRVRMSRLLVNAGLQNRTPYGSFFRYLINLEGVEVENTPGRIASEAFPPDSELFDRKYFVGLEGTYRYESYDDVLNPTNGLLFRLQAGSKMNLRNTDNIFGYIDPRLEMYNAISQNRKWVLRTRLDGQFNIGDGYEFWQAAELGGNSGLRGYRLHRFAGKTAFAAGADIRYSFEQFKTRFLPFQIGVFTGYDIGRVWVDSEDSNKWHDSYGGGFWINNASAINGTVSFFAGSEGLRVDVGFGFRF